MRTVIELPQGNAALQREYLSALADSLCTEFAEDFCTQRHRNLAAQAIDLLITNYPDCPRWASMAVDQLTVILENCD